MCAPFRCMNVIKSHVYIGSPHCRHWHIERNREHGKFLRMPAEWHFLQMICMFVRILLAPVVDAVANAVLLFLRQVKPIQFFEIWAGDLFLLLVRGNSGCAAQLKYLLLGTFPTSFEPIAHLIVHSLSLSAVLVHLHFFVCSKMS